MHRARLHEHRGGEGGAGTLRHDLTLTLTLTLILTLTLTLGTLTLTLGTITLTLGVLSDDDRARPSDGAHPPGEPYPYPEP